MKIHILDCTTYRTEDGKVFVTHSRPTIPPPDNDWQNWGWHDILHKWMPVDQLNLPREAEI